MPGCSSILDDIDPGTIVDAPQSVKLWFPSALATTSCDAWCVGGLAVLQFQLQYAQATNALDHLHHLCCLLQGLILQSKKHPSPTQQTMTQSWSVWEGLEVRKFQVCARYRDACIALLCLHPLGAWIKFFKELKNEDVHGPGREEDNPSESQFVPSWIWCLRAPPTPLDLPGSPSSTTTLDNLAQDSVLIHGSSKISAKEVEDYILVDWARAREQAKQFEEEVELSVEEMRQTLLFFSWSASKWEERAKERANNSDPPSDNVLQGLPAYTYRKSSMFRGLIKAFFNNWHNCLEPKGLGNKWLADYSALITPQKVQHSIPSIIPPTLTEDQDNSGDDIIFDQDDALKQLAEGSTEPEADSELYNDFIQIMAEG